jgi:acetyl-CoA acyltransferase
VSGSTGGNVTMREACVVGVGMIRFGRYPDSSVQELGGQAALLALRDAGVTIRDVQFFACGNLFQANAMVGQRILQQIGQTGIPVINVSNACATGSTAFREAYVAVGSGEYDVALAVGVEQMGKMGLLTGGPRGESVEGVLGSGLMPAVFGQAGVEHMRRYGTTVEQFARVSVKNHQHSVHNPLSQYRKAVTLEEVLGARMVAYPNTLYMCCPTGDGAAAAVVVSAAKARQLGGTPIRILASALTSDPWTERDLTLPDVSTLTRNAARSAYETAGVEPGDLDLVELHDCFATAELLHYENLGLCRDGEAGRLIDEGRTALGGDVPVNASGGLLSKGHPLGATGVANVHEIVTQLRGEAGPRQVEGATVGLAHVIGLGSACTIQILAR